VRSSECRSVILMTSLLINYFAAFEEKQMRLKALRNRQDLFQEEVRNRISSVLRLSYLSNSFSVWDRHQG